MFILRYPNADGRGRRHCDGSSFVNVLRGMIRWISAAGQVHDYCHTCVNGLAAGFGIVPPAQGREILERVMRKPHEIVL